MAERAATARSYNGPRRDVAALLPASVATVLDIGCARGEFGHALRATGITVWGLEKDAEAAASAATVLDNVLTGDACELIREIGDGMRFDAVVCSDILEHLVDPEQLLRDLRSLLVEDCGVCLVSIPNVRFFTTFTNLGLRGTWPTKDRGVHDRTHLRWFTDRDARAMFSRAGFRVDEMTTHYRLADEPKRRRNRYARFVAKGPLRGFLAYQYLYRLSIVESERTC